MLIVITPEDDFPDEIEIIKKILEYPFVSVHIRKPKLSEEQLYQWITSFHNEQISKMVLHKHHKLIEKFPFKGIHFSEQEKKRILSSPKEKNFFLKQNIVLSAAFHNRNEAVHQDFFSYGLLSPVFNSISKKGYLGNLFCVSENKKPIIALGGITPQNIIHAQQMGFDGVAVLGYIWNSYSAKIAWKEIYQQYINVFN